MLPVGRGPPAGSARRSRPSSRRYRVEVDASDETVGKRIRDAELEKIPFVVVYGDKESEASLAVRERGGEQSTQSLAELPRCAC